MEDKSSPVEHRFGWCALVGPPNAGKSTLMNSILGQKIAIVSPKPQTTRNRISGILTSEDAQIVFLDTPGVHKRKGRLNRILVQTAWRALAGADAVMLVLDAYLYSKRPDIFEFDLGGLTKPLKESGRPPLIVANKVDMLKDKSLLLPLFRTLDETFLGCEIFPVSALNGTGLDTLLKRVRESMPAAAAEFPPDQVSTVSLRFMASEIIREKIFTSTRQELPYSTAVEIEIWNEKPETGITEIVATIYVGRSSHKPMVIGKGGEMLKKIGSEARLELEELLEGKVFLNLWVKVREDWTEDMSFLSVLGLTQ